MSDRIKLKEQNHPPKLRTEYEEDEPSNCLFGLTPPVYPPSSRNTRNSFFSQSSHRSAQFNSIFPVLSPDGASIGFNYAQPENHHDQTGQTYPCHMTQPSPISWLPPETPFQFSAMPYSSISQGASPSVPIENALEHPIGAKPISYWAPGATDTQSTAPQPVYSSPHVPFSPMPHSISRGNSRGVTRLSAHKRAARAQQEISFVPATDKQETTPKPVSPSNNFESCGPATDSDATTPEPASSSTHHRQFSPMPYPISHRTPRGVLRLSAHKRAIRAQKQSCVPERGTDKHATTLQFSSGRHANVPQPVSPEVDDSLPQGIHGTHAQHAATSELRPQVTIRRSDPNKKMTPAETYMYVYFSPEWRIDETIRQNGKYKGRTEYFYYNLVLPKQFRSLSSAEEYIRTKKIPDFMRGKKKQKTES